MDPTHYSNRASSISSHSDDSDYPPDVGVGVIAGRKAEVKSCYKDPLSSKESFFIDDKETFIKEIDSLTQETFENAFHRNEEYGLSSFVAVVKDGNNCPCTMLASSFLKCVTKGLGHPITRETENLDCKIYKNAQGENLLNFSLFSSSLEDLEKDDAFKSKYILASDLDSSREIRGDARYVVAVKLRAKANDENISSFHRKVFSRKSEKWHRLAVEDGSKEAIMLNVQNCYKRMVQAQQQGCNKEEILIERLSLMANLLKLKSLGDDQVVNQFFKYEFSSLKNAFAEIDLDDLSASFQ